MDDIVFDRPGALTECTEMEEDGSNRSIDEVARSSDPNRFVVEETPDQKSDAKASWQMDTTTKEQERSWRDLLKGLARGCDVTRISLGAHFLRPKSTLECLAATLQHGKLMSELNKGQSEIDRMIAVTKFHVSGLIKEVFDGKKPYNPILGETSAWAFDNGSTTSGISHMICEQARACDNLYSTTDLHLQKVSHHPPISAFYIRNKSLAVSMEGYMHTGAQFNGNSIAIPFGQRTLRLEQFGEDYMMTMPTMQFRGLFFGARGVEWTGPVIVWCKKTGLVCEMEFKPLGFLGMWGEWHAGKLRRDTNESEEVLYDVSGHWDTKLILRDKSTGAEQVLYDYDECHAKEAPQRLQLSNQLPTDSTVCMPLMVWGKVTEALLAGDLNVANREKLKVEDEQRALRVKEAEQKVQWTPKWFKKKKNGEWTTKLDEAEKYIEENMRASSSIDA
ncbi:hypothetical protein GUITHDRAFT_122119 [Guillardia theta CCMP2712]|uniref:Oxysterol binding protein n=1 Tax=Guillardia theta (strain CCMP2712) TaxID=905079 RepID=L1I6H7_GUITC|nr:hypothetical protein GUITHDRAFT_122119 [Guillardia theta CCMP2712]EKX31692.1 hypothetical protein GUITHDRAFT_122119 [Guillardia theta CCMP2712]|eukprot:XP_005818672.1 hypothetical protein GUITHDRAFT_122119 [Guillardia theta CCMP2712]